MGKMVGAPGFKPGTSCAQGRRAIKLRYAPTGVFSIGKRRIFNDAILPNLTNVTAFVTLASTTGLNSEISRIVLRREIRLDKSRSILVPI